ncbi:MAG: LysM peptidoglycan-binding domain-containing protein [Planctomycetaceae bacterium]|nr:LysM peptidoglycan-binding domain-containing protein [Planctomycetaceae bacterium]
MGNRNAARHLILVASILICFFAYMGYRFLGPGSRDNGDDATVAAAPSASPLPGLTPPGGGALDDNDIDNWVPSLAGDDLPLETGNGPVVMPPPPGSAAVGGTASASTPHSGAITGLVPGPPADSSASLRPTTSSAPVNLPIPPTGATAQSGAASSLPPSLTPPGSGSAASAAGSAPRSGSGFSTVDDSPDTLPSATDGWTSLPFDDDTGDDDFTSGSAFPGAGPAAGETSLAAAPVTAPGTTRPTTPLRPTTASAGTGAAPVSTGQPGVSAPVPPISRPGTGASGSGTSPVPAPATASRPGLSGPAAAGAASRPVPPVSGSALYDPDEDDDELNLSGSETLRIYVVLPGDTLTSIAARELGAASLADNIFLLNRDVIPDPNQLMAGSKIRLPVRNAPGRGADGDPYPVRRPTQGLGNVHIVARGDTLSSISLQYYGTSTAWRQLHEANRNILPNPNQLVVGMELTIPPFDELPR